jgi:cysteine desulfuration protein SufE
MSAIDDAIRETEEEFALFDDWEERYAHVIDLGKALPALPIEERTEETRVRGCVSQVWLKSAREGDRLTFHGASDAHIVRGLLAVMLRIFSGRTAMEILSVDPAALMARLGFAEALTPQRSNGLAAVITRIRREAEAALQSGSRTND